MFKKLIVGFLALIQVTALYAASVGNLYKEEVILPSSLSEQDLLKEAFNESVEKVLIRVSGRADRIDSDLLKQAKKDASSWVSQHSITDQGELKPFGEEMLPAKKVSVNFYPQSIDRFLSSNALPVWGNNRPTVLLWLVEDRAGRRTMSGATSPSELLQSISTQAKQAGLLVYAPLLDEVDKEALTTGEAWGLFEDAIRSASQRYETDTTLVVRVSEYAQSMSLKANLLLPDGQMNPLEVSSIESGEAAQAIVSEVAATFSSKYASIQGVDENSVALLSVDGVETFAAVKQIERYLNSIGVVNSAQVNAIEGKKVSFKIDVNGDKQKLRDSIALGNVISRLSVGALEPGANVVEFYKFNGA